MALVSALACIQSVSDRDVPRWVRQVIEEKGKRNAADTFLGDLVSGILDSGIAFLDDQRLIVYNVETSGQLSSRASHEVASAFRLHLRLLNVESGVTLDDKYFNVLSHGSSLSVTSSGIIVNTGETVKLVTRDFGKSQDLVTRDKDELLTVRISPTGATVLIIHFNPKTNVSRLDLFSSGGLKFEKSWSALGLYKNLSISERGIAAHRGDAVGMTDFGSSSWKLWPKGPGYCSGSTPTLYSDTAFIYNCDRLIADSVDGHIIMTEHLDRDIKILEKKPVANQKQIVGVTAVQIEAKPHIFAESNIRPIGFNILLYDMVKVKRSFIIAVDPIPKFSYDFDLSTDGTKLAVLRDGVVSVYNLN